jgi:hypothetical protein
LFPQPAARNAATKASADTFHFVHFINDLTPGCSGAADLRK